MRKLVEDLQIDNEADNEFASRDCPDSMGDLIEEILKELHEHFLDKFKKKHGIVAEKGSIGFSEKEKKWYGWSHRAAFGFGIGDKVFEKDFGEDDTDFDKHGSKTIKTMEDAKKAAIAFARYVS